MEDIFVLGGPAPAPLTPAQSGRRRVVDRFTADQVDEATRLWDGGASRQEVAAYLKISVGTLGEFRAYGQLAHLKRRQGSGGGRPRGWRPGAEGLNRTSRDPTPAQIKARAAAIRATWTPEDAQIRANRIDPTGAMSMQTALRTSGVRVYRVGELERR